ncbi:hypothetical protein [Paenibacillus sp. MBLB4367]|uniref:hypothetical protein n=1 Tax=Paenibacillus sp. MBLB4367 TaxID=3384767 RepID=UPI0039082FF8
MHLAPIFFQFAESKAAYQAMDTLHELGFRANWIDHAHPEHRPTLQVYIENNDLTSALEITQAFGGQLLETSDSGSESQAYTSAYGLNGIPIPAHVVTEDLPEGYMSSADGGPYQGTTSDNSDDQPFDPSDDDYSQFSAGIHL